MTFIDGCGASILDDPDYPLRIQTSGDYNGWRSAAVRKEPWTFEWLKTIGSGVFYDVGACVGSYSLMAAARGAKVVAIEPVPVNAAECVANGRLNSLIFPVLPYAAGSARGTMAMFVSSTPGYGNASTLNRGPGQTEHITVIVRTLRDIANDFGLPTHIKIDVEGAEVEVMRGAGTVLDKVESVICEIKDDANEADVLLIAQAHGLESVWDGGRRTEQERTHVFRRVK